MGLIKLGEVAWLGHGFPRGIYIKKKTCCSSPLSRIISILNRLSYVYRMHCVNCVNATLPKAERFRIQDKLSTKNLGFTMLHPLKAGKTCSWISSLLALLALERTQCVGAPSHLVGPFHQHPGDMFCNLFGACCRYYNTLCNIVCLISYIYIYISYTHTHIYIYIYT